MITKKDVKDIVLEATDTILDGVLNMFDEHNKENVKDFTDVKNKIDSLSVKVDDLDDTIDGIKADISTTPTRREFNQLKSKINKFAFA